MEQVLKIARAQSPDEQRAAMVQIPYKVGDVVRVKEGTFAGMSGDVEEINEAKGLVRVMITVFRPANAGRIGSLAGRRRSELDRKRK